MGSKSTLKKINMLCAPDDANELFVPTMTLLCVPHQHMAHTADDSAEDETNC